MRFFILLGLAIACVAYSVAQQVSGGKNYQPRVGITNSFHDGTSPTIAFMGGLRTNEWAFNLSLGGDFTSINEYAGTQIRYSGLLKGAHIWTTNAGDLKLKLWRPIGTNVHNFITNFYTGYLTGGTNYLSFGTGFPVQEGDTIAVWVSNTTQKVTVKSGQGLRYSASEQSGSAYTFTTANAYQLNLAVYGEPTAAVILGDSIMTPWPWGFTAGAQSDFIIGNATNGITWKLHNELGYTRATANFSYHGKTMEHVNTNQMRLATNTGAGTLFIAAGVNDVDAGLAWSDVLTNLNSIRAKHSGTLVFGEILPWTAGNDTEALTIRTWNTNLAVWCATSSASLLLVHDFFGTNRATTSQLDDLKPEFNLDGVHLTRLARWHYASNLLSVLP